MIRRWLKALRESFCWKHQWELAHFSLRIPNVSRPDIAVATEYHRCPRCDARREARYTV